MVLFGKTKRSDKMRIHVKKHTHALSQAAAGIMCSG